MKNIIATGLTLMLVSCQAPLRQANAAAEPPVVVADEGDPSPPPRFQPWQTIWQCNDIRVTITARDPFSVEYDLGGMIWGGSRFTVIKGELFFNGRPCLPLRPVGY